MKNIISMMSKFLFNSNPTRMVKSQNRWFKPRAEVLESRVTPATVYFYADTSNVWSDPDNWVLANNAPYGQMPTTSDNVYIEDRCDVDNSADITVASLTITASCAANGAEA